MASTRQKALVALLLLGLLLGAGAGYYVITSINQQGGLFNQALGFIFPNYFHHIPYAYASPLTLQLDMNWLEQIFKNIPKDFKIPEELQNVPVDYIPPIHQFSAGLIDPEATVMIVIPHDPNYPHQYWKVSTFDYYGEGDWYKTQLNTYPISITAPSSLPPNAQFFTIIMNITHDVSSSTALPVLYPDPYFTTEISSSQGDLNDAEIERDEYNNSRVNLFFTDKGVSEISYDVAGVPPDTDWVSSNAMPATYTPPAIRDVYTQLPSSLANDPTFKSFADSFSGVGNNAYEVAQAVQAELLSGKYINNITRLTEGAPLTDEDPVVRFLKEKEGTCIDFASTFVTTLRYLGVSARLVIGYDDRYAQADYSGGTLKYIIKAFNIYAWAEVWVPTSPSGEGIWVPFDPTPPPTITFPSGTEWIDQQFNVPPELIGSLGPIALFSYGLSTETTVFTAKPEEPGFAVRYWRVKAYNYYSDGEWNCTNQTRYELQTWTKSKLESTIPETFEYYNVLMNVSHDVNLTIVIPIPFPGPYILNGSSYTISSVQGDMTSASLSQDIFNNTYLNALFTDSGTSTLNYTIAVYNLDLSAINSSAQPPSTGNIPEEISELYLQIPSTLESDPTFTDFVNTIESGDNAYETALNALNRLTSGEYIYNASMMVSGVNIQEDPIVWFLKNKVGTPILFASTYVMALRHFGIPARLVIGYLTQNTTSDGEVVHEAKNIYIYAWAEVWIPTGEGNGYWVSFDPTPDPLPATFATINGFILWDRMQRDDPNVQFTDYEVSISTSSSTITRGNALDVTVNVKRDGAAQANCLVEVFTYDPWEQKNYSAGSGVTNGGGSVTVTITVDNKIKIGNLTIIAKVHNGSSSNDPLIAHNYTAEVILEGDTAMSAEVKSTAPYTTDTTLIRSDGTVRINGTLYDPNYSGTNSGVPYVKVTITMDGNSVGEVYTDGEGYFEYEYPDNGSLNLTDYKFQAQYSDPAGHFGASSAPSPATVISVYARSKVTITLDPADAIKKGSDLTFISQLTFDNGTSIEEETSVVAHWCDSTNTEIRTYSLADAGGGTYKHTATINDQQGYYNVYVTYNGTTGSGGRILGSTSESKTILVYEGGLIWIDDAPAEAYRGETAWFGGSVKDEAGNPVADIMLQFHFINDSGAVYVYNSSEKTGADGAFYCGVPIPPSLSPGTYSVEAVSLNATLNALSNSVDVQVKTKTAIELSGFTVSSFTLTFSAKQAEKIIGSYMPSEYAFITATVIDQATQTPLDGLEFTVYYQGNALASNVTDSNGFLNITLEPDDLASLPVNAISELTLSYPGNETLGPVSVKFLIHIFNEASIDIDTPENAVIGEPFTINVTVRDPNGNPVIGREFAVYWNVTALIGSSETGSNGNGSLVYNVPGDVVEGNVKLYVVLDSGDSGMVTVPVVKQRFPGGLNMMMLYLALQIEGSTPILPLAIIGVIVALLIVLVYVYISRRRRIVAKKPKEFKWEISELEELVKAGKFKDAVIRIYKMYVELLSANMGLEREPHETTRDLAKKAIKNGLTPRLVNSITQLFEKARFSRHQVTGNDYNEAAKTFTEIYNEIVGGAISLG
nr:DUF4129 domain-containing protein [Candidatus Bathyarchaeota archaeon]